MEKEYYNYTLTKIELLENKYSAVPKGMSVNGRNLYLIRNNAIVDTPFTSVRDIKINDEIAVVRGLYDYVKTSPVSEILQINGDNKIVFKTQTSIYKLELS